MQITRRSLGEREIITLHSHGNQSVISTNHRSPTNLVPRVSLLRSEELVGFNREGVMWGSIERG